MKNELPGDPGLVSSNEALKHLMKIGEGAHELPVEHFFRLPEKNNYKISKKGTYYSFLAPWKRRMNLFVVKLEDGSERQVTQMEDRNITGYAWVNDEDIVFLKDTDGDENYHLWVTDVREEKARDLTPYEGVRCDIIDILVDDEEHVIIAMNRNNSQVFDPYRLNIRSGALEQLAENNDPGAPIMSWLTDHEGRLRMANQLVDGVISVMLYRDTENEPFREVLRTDYKTEVRPVFFDFEKEHEVWALSNLERDKLAVVKFDCREGKETGPIIYQHDEVDIGHVGYSRVRKKATTVSYVTDKRHYHFLDEQRAKVQKRLEETVPGMEVVITSATRDEKKFIFRGYSDRSLGAYFAFDSERDEIIRIAEVSPWIDPETMNALLPVSYESRDGLKINGYLTLPGDIDDGPYPIVVNPHGGPWHRDTWGFNPEVQLFTSRGFGVLQMNFRGSTGYGRAFWEASFKQWGQKMQDDITDGVQWLINEGIADKENIAIYGGSYGGYATLAGVCYTPDLYRCAIDYVGVSNLFTFMETVPPYWEPYLKMMYEMVGHPEKDREMMEAYSPALNADKISVPLFVIQGANDPRVNIDESDQIVRSLRKRDIDVPYMVKYDEGHGFRNEENQFEAYKAMLGFLLTHMEVKE